MKSASGSAKGRKSKRPDGDPSVKQRENSEAPGRPDSRERSNANLKPFQPGQSGNPKGRPKSKTISEALRELLEKEGNEGKLLVDQIAEILLEKAKFGDLSAIKEVADRTEGKPRQQHQHSGPDGAAIPISIITPVKPERERG
jgi:hypothetical protein